MNHLVSAEAYRALSVLLCLTPYTPLFFMGQEWAASSPFLYFTDHHTALGRMVTKGRRKEFAAFPEYSDRTILRRIPDPQARKTFERSKLKWRECETGKHALVFDLYRECLRLRQGVAAFRPMERQSWRSGVSNWGFRVGRFWRLPHALRCRRRARRRAICARTIERALVERGISLWRQRRDRIQAGNG